MPEERYETATEPATPRRRQEARERGHVARSADLSAAIVLLAAMLALSFFGGALYADLSGYTKQIWSTLGETDISPDNAAALLLGVTWFTVKMLLPIVLMIMAFALAANLAQTGFVFTGHPLVLNLEKLNPISGLQRIFSVRSFVRLIASIFKIAVISTVTWVTLMGEKMRLASLADVSVPAIARTVADLALLLGFRAALALLVLAILDYGYQRWQYEQDIRMTRKEIQEELRRLEGDPKIRERRRAIQRHIAMQRMMAQVPKATVVITNPTEIAVALKYDRSEPAPKVVAKGSWLIAERIRKIAEESNVPIHQDVALARGLFKAVDVGQFIPVQFWKAVIEILTYLIQVGKLRREEFQAGGEIGTPRAAYQVSGFGFRVSGFGFRVLWHLGTRDLKLETRNSKLSRRTMAAAAGRSTALEVFVKNLDLVLVVGIIAIVIIIFVPPPTQLIDLLLVISIASSVAILLTSIYVRQPLQFSVFPSLLLITTAYRLALNVATTRLILTNADALEEGAAGEVIRTFGQFVAGNNVTIGFVIFAIIVIVQFVVITKGANRISEVAARFTLDAMPGKQMSIDADLNAGLIKETEARERRQAIAREADFYGAMDGATKFVRGDAIAGIIVTLVNVIGGFIVGMLEYGMDAGTAARVFAKLTIGDGLVSQIPALIVSLSAGLIVTRTTAASNLGADLLTQVFSSPRALTVTAVFLGLLVLTPLPDVQMIGVAATIGFVAYLLLKGKRQAVAQEAARREKEAVRKPEKVEGLLHVDPMELEIGYGLIRLVDTAQGGDLLERIAMLRRQTAVDLGFVLPPVRIRDNMQLEPNQYVFKIRGTSVASGTAFPDQFLAMDSGAATGKIDGIRTTEPVFGLPAWWIPPANKERAEALGYTVVDTTTVLTTHLTEIIKNNASQLLTREDVNGLISNLKESAPAVVNEVIPNLLKVGEVQKVLQNLLREWVSIRDLGTVLETLGDFAPRTKDLEVLTEYVRYALARGICSTHQSKDGAIYVATLDPRLEDTIKNSIERTETGSFLSLSPKMQKAMMERMKVAFETLARGGHPPVVLASPQIRWHVKRIADMVQSGVAVLSHNEVAKVKELRIEALETVSVE